MAGKRRLTACPQCSGARTVPVPRQYVDKDGKSSTKIVQEDCPTCDGSGSVVDFDG